MVAKSRGVRKSNCNSGFEIFKICNFFHKLSNILILHKAVVGIIKEKTVSLCCVFFRETKYNVSHTSRIQIKSSA